MAKRISARQGKAAHSVPTHAVPAGMKAKKVSRAQVRSAALSGFRAVKGSPHSVKITPGQRAHITQTRRDV
jgi:hypothetical protein